MIGWYFSRENKKLGYGDGRNIKLGQTHKLNGKLILCEYGLHASKNILSALNYAPGSVIWKVKLSGEIIHGDDKSAATERTYLEGGIDITNVLRKFARMCALDVIHLWAAPEITIEYLKKGKEELRAAAWEAAWDAAGDAARDAARDATGDAAWAAARAAAWAACDAAWDAARDAAMIKQEVRLKKMVSYAIKNDNQGGK